MFECISPFFIPIMYSMYQKTKKTWIFSNSNLRNRWFRRETKSVCIEKPIRHFKKTVIFFSHIYRITHKILEFLFLYRRRVCMCVLRIHIWWKKALVSEEREWQNLSVCMYIEWILYVISKKRLFFFLTYLITILDFFRLFIFLDGV